MYGIGCPHTMNSTQRAASAEISEVNGRACRFGNWLVIGSHLRSLHIVGSISRDEQFGKNECRYDTSELARLNALKQRLCLCVMPRVMFQEINEHYGVDTKRVALLAFPDLIVPLVTRFFQFGLVPPPNLRSAAFQCIDIRRRCSADDDGIIFFNNL